MAGNVPPYGWAADIGHLDPINHFGPAGDLPPYSSPHFAPPPPPPGHYEFFDPPAMFHPGFYPGGPPPSGRYDIFGPPPPYYAHPGPVLLPMAPQAIPDGDLPPSPPPGFHGPAYGGWAHHHHYGPLAPTTAPCCGGHGGGGGGGGKPAGADEYPGLNMPGGLRQGISMLHAQSHTLLNVFHDSTIKPWKSCKPLCKPPPTKFHAFRVDDGISVQELLKRLGAKEDGILTECIDRGGGKWIKGSVIEGKSDNAKKTLSEVGWDSKRGIDIPPVWLVLEKEKKKD